MTIRDRLDRSVLVDEAASPSGQVRDRGDVVNVDAPRGSWRAPVAVSHAGGPRYESG